MSIKYSILGLIILFFVGWFFSYFYDDPFILILTIVVIIIGFVFVLTKANKINKLFIESNNQKLKVIFLAFKIFGLIAAVSLSIILWYIAVPMIVICYLYLFKNKLSTRLKKIITVATIIVCFISQGTILYINRTPTITLLNPTDNINVQLESITVNGFVSPKKSKLLINELPINVNGDGSFEFKFILNNEKNPLNVQATNSNNIETKSLVVTRIFTEEEKNAIEKAKEEAKIKAQKKQEAKLAKQKAELEDYYRTPAGKICKSHLKWSKADCERLVEREIWIGMEYEMVTYLMGLPSSVNTSNYGSGNKYQACWDYSYDPNCFYFGEDGIIDSYN